MLDLKVVHLGRYAFSIARVIFFHLIFQRKGSALERKEGNLRDWVSISLILPRGNKPFDSFPDLEWW